MYPVHIQFSAENHTFCFKNALLVRQNLDFSQTWLAVFWDVSLFSLIEVTPVSKVLAATSSGQPFITLMMETASTSDTLVSFYQTT
jgi:hypothetical protein